MVSHQPAKFGGHRHGGSGDINIPGNMTIFHHYFHHYYSIFPKTHGMPCSHTWDFRLKHC